MRLTEEEFANLFQGITGYRPSDTQWEFARAIERAVLEKVLKKVDALGPPSGETNGERGDGSCCDGVFHHIREVLHRAAAQEGEDGL